MGNAVREAACDYNHLHARTNGGLVLHEAKYTVCVRHGVIMAMLAIIISGGQVAA